MGFGYTGGEFSKVQKEFIEKYDALKEGYYGTIYNTPQERFLDEFEMLAKERQMYYWKEQSGFSSYTIEDTREGKIKDLKIQGETKQNFFHLDSFIYDLNSPYYSIVDGKLNIIANDTRNNVSQFTNWIEVRYSDTYTIVANGVHIKAFGVLTKKLIAEADSVCTFETKNEGQIEIMFTTTESYPKVIENVMLLRGDYSTKSKPNYFIGTQTINNLTIKSSNEDNTQEDVRNIPLLIEDGLKSVGDIHDSIEGGKLIQRIGKYYYGENSVVSKYTFDTKTPKTCLIEVRFNFPKGLNDWIVCNKYIMDYWDSIRFYDRPQIYSSWYYSTVYLRVWRSDLKSQDLAGIQQFLKDSGIWFYYVLENPIVHDLDCNLNLKSYEGTTKIDTVGVSEFKILAKDI